MISGTAVDQSASPYDVPIAMRVSMLERLHNHDRVSLEFRYVIEGEPPIRQTFGDVEVEIGAHSKRLYRIVASIPGASAVDRHPVEVINAAIDSLMRSSEAKSRMDNYAMAKNIVSGRARLEIDAAASR